MVEGLGVCWNFLRHTFFRGWDGEKMGCNLAYPSWGFSEVCILFLWNSKSMRLDDWFPFGRSYSQVRTVSFRECNSWKNLGFCFSSELLSKKLLPLVQTDFSESFLHTFCKPLGSFQSFGSSTTVDGSEIPIPTTVWMYKNPVNNGMFHHLSLNWWVDPGFLVAINLSKPVLRPQLGLNSIRGLL